MTDMTTLVPIEEFDWAANHLAHQYVTCRNHPTARYTTKHPRLRHLHIIAFPEGFAGECPCPYSDLAVMLDGTFVESLRPGPGNAVAGRDPSVAWEREGTDDPCERGTVGCSTNHNVKSECETW